jgi:hypothetical protein
MLVFSTEKYISTYADVFQIGIGDRGFLLIDKRTYDELLEAQLRVDIEAEKTRLKVSSNLDAIAFFEEYVPQPVSRLALLFDRMSFDVPLDLEAMFGMLSTITTTHGVMYWFGLKEPDFKLRRFSALLLEEHVVPRKLFLTSCIPYEQMMHPERERENIHQFLYLAPYGAAGGMMPSMVAQEADPQAAAGLCMDDDDQQYYIDRMDDYLYIGDGMFQKTDGTAVAIDIYDDAYLYKAWGIDIASLTASFSSSGSRTEETEEEGSDEEKDSGPIKTSADPTELASDNNSTTKTVTELFKMQRKRMGG